MAEERGQYRAIHSVLTTSPEFIALPPDAKLVFYTLRFCKECNIACLFQFYPETLPGRTGLGPKASMLAFDTLCHSHWIAYQYPIVWIRNGLRFSPGVTLKNQKHLTAVKTIVSSMPKLEIIAMFCSYYGLPIPTGYPMPKATDTESIQGIGIGIGKREREEGPPPVTSPAGGGSMNGFQVFWDRYPQKEGIGKAEESWKRHTKRIPLEEIMAGLDRWLVSEKWAKGFVTMPATWINQKRWRDNPQPALPVSSAGLQTLQAGARLKKRMDDKARTVDGEVEA